MAMMENDTKCSKEMMERINRNPAEILYWVEYFNNTELCADYNCNLNGAFNFQQLDIDKQ